MSRTYRSKEQAHSYWQGVLEQWKQSGLTIGQFCRKHQITESAFYSWRKRLSSSGSPEQVSQATGAPFVQVDMHEATKSPLMLQLASGHMLQITDQVNVEALTKVLRALHEAKLC